MDTGKGKETGNGKEKEEKNETKRERCEFGKKCYRKNPAHKREFIHPNDSNWENENENDEEAEAEKTDEDEDNEENDRPECEYGTECYRENPQHKKQFQHSRPPVRQAAKSMKNFFFFFICGGGG